MRPGTFNQRLHLFHGFDDVGTGPLGDFQHQRRLTVDPGEPSRVFEGSLKHSHVAKGHYGVAAYLDRHGHNILHGFNNARNLHGHATGTGIQASGSNQLIVASDQRRQLIKVDAIAFKHLGIDNDLQEVFPVTTNVHFQHFRNAFDGILQTPGNSDQLAFGKRPGEANRHDRKQRHVNFIDPWFVSFLRQPAAGGINLFPHILKRDVRIKPGVEFQHHRGVTLGSRTTHFLDALEGTQFLLHGPDKQALTVFRADSLQCH